MQLLATQYSLKTQALEIYFAGCKGPHCEGCHNPESWSALGETFSAKELTKLIVNKVTENSTLVKNVMLLGGEPLDQPHEELYDLLSYLNKELPKIQLWLFTKYEIYDIPFNLRVKFNYIKTGRYVKELSVSNIVQYGIELATSNQKILRRGFNY